MTRQSLDLNIKSVKTILKVLPTYDFFFNIFKTCKIQLSNSNFPFGPRNKNNFECKTFRITYLCEVRRLLTMCEAVTG
jgi:hypothetical protein